MFKDLDESDLLRSVASEHDVVIHAANGFHVGSGVALIQGLGKRRRATGKDVYYMHVRYLHPVPTSPCRSGLTRRQTSGTSNLGDRPVSKAFIETREFFDTEDIFSYEKGREAREAYPQRTAELEAVEEGERNNVKTYVIMSPTIYGFGSGFFKKLSIQIPQAIRTAITTGVSVYIGDGAEIWTTCTSPMWVALYEIILEQAISGAGIPSGRSGIYFSENGHHSWIDFARGVAEAGVELGAVKSAEPVSIGLEDAAKVEGGNAQVIELGFASRSVTNAVLGRNLGWVPKKNEED